MANDRLYVRCTECGRYEYVMKYSPGAAQGIERSMALISFVEKHLTECQKQDFDFEGPICIVFDSERTLCDAGGVIGLSKIGGIVA